MSDILGIIRFGLVITSGNSEMIHDDDDDAVVVVLVVVVLGRKDGKKEPQNAGVVQRVAGCAKLIELWNVMVQLL